MNRFLIIVIFAVQSQVGYGQQWENILEQVNQNNPEIKMLEQWLEAEGIRSKTGLLPEHPEVSGAYLIGNDDVMGNQLEFELVQRLKVPGFYKSNAKLKSADFEIAMMISEQEKRKVIAEAGEVYIQLIYLKEKRAFLEEQKINADQMLSLMEEGLRTGAVSKVDLDKVNFKVFTLTRILETLEYSIDAELAKLIRLNGGKTLDPSQWTYPSHLALPSLESLVESLHSDNPSLKMAGLKSKKSELEIAHQKIESYPDFEAAYKSERIHDQRLRGLHAGVSIPLWGNKTKMKLKQMERSWKQSEFQSVRNELEGELKMLHVKATSIGDFIERTEPGIKNNEIVENANALLDANQIDLYRYLQDLESVNQVVLDHLALKRDYYLVLNRISELVRY